MDNHNYKNEMVQDAPQKQEHKHLPLPISSLETNSTTAISLLPAGSFEPKELARLVLHFSNLLDANQTPRQKSALSTFYQSPAEYTLNGKTGPDGFGVTLEKYATLFDELLFLGAVFGNGLTKFVYDPTRNCEDTKRQGTCEEQEGGTYKITIFNLENSENYPDQAIKILIWVVLHEMTHAYLNNYSCEPCLDTWEGAATTGHGVAWFDTMSTVIKSARRWLGLKDVKGYNHCAVSLALELVHDCNREMPCQYWLERWGAQKEDVKKWMGIFESMEEGVGWLLERVVEEKYEPGWIVRWKVFFWNLLPKMPRSWSQLDERFEKVVQGPEPKVNDGDEEA